MQTETLEVVAPVLPHEKIDALISYFLKKVANKNAAELPEHIHDTFGLETIGFLIEALETMQAASEQWNRVARLILDKADNRFTYAFYGGTLIALSPYVSIDMRENVVEHFVKYGAADIVLSITTRQLFRNPTRQEILVMASHHRKSYTSSDADVWDTLICLADQDTAARIEVLHGEVRHHEEQPDLC